MRPRFLHRTAVIAAALMGLGLAQAAAADQDPVVMAVPSVSLSFSLGYLAEDLGFFAKEGVAVKQVLIQGLGAINAVISGSADFAEPSAASLTRAAAHGQRLLGIAELTDHPFVQIAFRKDLAAAGGFNPAAPLKARALLLKGRVIGADSVNSVVHAYVRLVAQAGGYDPETIRMAFMAPASMIGAFQSKQIDGFAMTPPWPEKPVLDGTAVMLASGPDGDPPGLLPFANTVLLTRPDFCAKRKTVCMKMGHAFADAAVAIRDHPDAALAALEKRFPTLDAKLMSVSFDVLRKITPVPPALSAAALANVETYNIEAGLMQPREKLKSYDGLFTDAYVR